jgi:hypothetical protein
MIMVRNIGVAAAVALVAFLAASNASFAASKKSQSDQQSQSDLQRGPYTPDIKTTQHGASRDFQGGGGVYYKRSKTHKHHSHSPANS